MARLRVKPWRGVGVSEDMHDALDELAASVGPLVVPIPGYGSYRDNDASGGTDNGSGHLDAYARDSGGWDGDSRRLFVANARELGFMAFYRAPRWWSPVRQKWLTASWAPHFHLILKDSADLSPGARQQRTQWYAGSNGLAGFYIGQDWRYDPDDGPRKHLKQTWAQYLEKREDIVASIEDLEAALRRIIPGIVRAEVRRELDSIETARSLFTRHRIVRDTSRENEETAARVTPSNQLEQAARAGIYLERQARAEQTKQA